MQQTLYKNTGNKTLSILTYLTIHGSPEHQFCSLGEGFVSLKAALGNFSIKINVGKELTSCK